jgi:hypothetical protein
MEHLATFEVRLGEAGSTDAGDDLFVAILGRLAVRRGIGTSVRLDETGDPGAL